MPLKESRLHNEYYLHNTALLPGFSPGLFDSKHSTNESNSLGRGTAFILQAGGVDLVLRHYQRGGLMRRLLSDSYVFTGLKRTRMWQEMALLAQLQRWQLPAPVPAAARCRVYGGLWYSGDLVTQRIPNAQTLSERLQQGPLDPLTWQSVGQVVAQFHNHGVFHADLNANNIMLNSDNAVFLIDFDKGAIKPVNTQWQQANMGRLLRSLNKQQRLNASYHFDDVAWQALHTSYLGVLTQP